MLIIWIIVFSLAGTAGVIIAASVFLSFPEKTQEIMIPCLISYAAGVLLSAAFLGLIPHALEHVEPTSILFAVLLGVIFFFFLEKLVLWHHCHDRECEVHEAAGPMILIGDTVHNFADGVVIAASFLGSIPLGVVAGLSIIAHEIPQETGDIAILLHSGYKKRKALFLNILSSLSSFPAAIISYYALESVEAAIPYVMALSAASFLYIALADLSPELHRKIGLKHAVRQLILLGLGVITIMLLLHIHPG